MAVVDLHNPLLWGVLVAWILTVILHEFAHGLVAYWGGDYTIKERGGLSLNPLQYVDPVFSLLLPAIFLLMGGIPLPGGSTFIRRDLLRGRLWSSAVSLAGPFMNFLLFLACALPFHPKIGWLHPTLWGTPSNIEIFLGAMAVLQILAVLFNLVPVPPLDGFQALSPFMERDLRLKLSTPPTSTILFVIFFLVLWKTPDLLVAIFAHVITPLLHALGFTDWEVLFFANAYDTALFGPSSP